ncbi:MAG: hypothetical protein Q8O14_10250 [bacterium]|jgi:hypothetical protein|nr:hypothetical protein [bacterium]
MNWTPRHGWCVLRVVLHRHEGEFLAAQLRDAGIPAELFGDDCGGLGLGLPMSMGLALYVNETDLAAARELLDPSGERP